MRRPGLILEGSGSLEPFPFILVVLSLLSKTIGGNNLFERDHMVLLVALHHQVFGALIPFVKEVLGHALVQLFGDSSMLYLIFSSKLSCALRILNFVTLKKEKVNEFFTYGFAGNFFQLFFFRDHRH